MERKENFWTVSPLLNFSKDLKKDSVKPNTLHKIWLRRRLKNTAPHMLPKQWGGKK